MCKKPVFAAVDLGSNSFHLQTAKIIEGQLYPLDHLKETVQLAAGLTPDQVLDAASQNRALACLKRFQTFLHQSSPYQMARAVGTNTLRIARNAADFLAKAEEVLGMPIEIISGDEEARLIYHGVTHSLPITNHTRLVADIGGGSTELIIGNQFTPLKLRSLPMGCINFSQHFFSDGKITEENLQRAELAARNELHAIAVQFDSMHWQEAYGSSGTACVLARILTYNQYHPRSCEEVITSAGLDQLRLALLKAGDYRKLNLAGLNSARRVIIAGGFTIMSAVFSELKINTMAVTTSTLRQGLLHEMLKNNYLQNKAHHPPIS